MGPADKLALLLRYKTSSISKQARPSCQRRIVLRVLKQSCERGGTRSHELAQAPACTEHHHEPSRIQCEWKWQPIVPLGTKTAFLRIGKLLALKENILWQNRYSGKSRAPASWRVHFGHEGDNQSLSVLSPECLSLLHCTSVPLFVAGNWFSCHNTCVFDDW